MRYCASLMYCLHRMRFFYVIPLLLPIWAMYSTDVCGFVGRTYGALGERLGLDYISDNSSICFLS